MTSHIIQLARNGFGGSNDHGPVTADHGGYRDVSECVTHTLAFLNEQKI